jgi:hypothetical protein
MAGPAAQVALLVLLLTSAGLFVRTLQKLRAVDVGFRPDQVLAVGVPASPLRVIARRSPHPVERHRDDSGDRIARGIPAGAPRSENRSRRVAEDRVAFAWRRGCTKDPVKSLISQYPARKTPAT